MLPRDFIFSQNNLQMYVDCKRLFYLKEILRLAWPANESEPVKIQEERMATGSQFHLLCSQYLCGIPSEVLVQTIDNGEMMQWWNAFLSLELHSSSNLFPEKAITIPFGKFRLTAHFDLLIRQPDECHTIYDWKTNLKHPSKQQVENRLQTIIYPIVLNKFLSIEKMNNSKSIKMIYWYPEFPEQPYDFSFNYEKLKHQESVLRNLIQEISNSSPEDFIMTDSLQRCQICNYRSYCNRGDRAGEIIDDFSQEDQLNLV
jgi:hypothetical protein